MSQALEQFKDSMNDRSMDWIDGYDLDAFDQLTGEERNLAVQLMVTALTQNDIRAPRAFALQKDQVFAELLRQRFDSFKGTMRVEAALALHELGQNQAMDREIIAVLASDEEIDRRSAAFALRHFASSEVKSVLLRTVENDRDRDVRLAATLSLLLVSGLMQNELDMSQRPLILKMTSPDLATREAGLAELRLKITFPQPTSTGNVCSKCGKALKSAAKFCGSCATPVSVLRQETGCPKCGRPRDAEARFCPDCGASLTS